MVNVDLNVISDLLDVALDLEASAREPWLKKLAQTEPALAARLGALLSRQAELETDQLLMDGGRALGSDAIAKAAENSAAAQDAASQFMLHPGTQIGSYRLIKPIGKGGMASVWLAERSDGQLKREVALKLLHAWRNSAELVERFARERDMLAGLVHPNIARLYDAGITPSGQPWIALEYVEGLDLAAYADEHALTIQQRVKSMLQVMVAVQYAHQNLIVHRDLKPSNILVNQKGDVRLLDFGIAKLLLAENTDAAETELTRNSGRALTFRYAAPEQIEGRPITTATDVYALGLVLYELLTGSSAKGGAKRTHERDGTNSNAIAELTSLNTEILRPSRGFFSATAALMRGKLSPNELKSTLSGDLDTVLLKALAREPTRRYPTVGEFAADLRAWLERRPITARAPSIAYQIKMFISRQRIFVGFASVIAVVLLGAGAYSQAQRAEATAQRARAEEVQIFMANILSEAEPEGVKGEAALTAKGLLDAGVNRAREDYADKPLVRGVLLSELANVYLRINEAETGENLLKEAIPLIEKSATEDEPSLHLARSHLGGRLMGNGEAALAIVMLNSVLANCTRMTTTCLDAKGNAHFHLANNLDASDSERLLHAQNALSMYEKTFGPKSSHASIALIKSADLERQSLNFQHATELLSRAEKNFFHRRTTAQQRYMLSEVQSKLAFDKGEYLQAGIIIDRVLAELSSEQQREYRFYFQVFAANVANYQGLAKVAIAHATAARLNVAASSSIKPISLVYGLLREARANAIQGEYVLAENSMEEIFKILLQAGLDESSIDWLDGLHIRAEINARQGHLKVARDQLEATLTAFRARYPNEIMDQVHLLDTLGAVSLAMGDAAFAKARHEEEIQLLANRLPADHPLCLRAALQLQHAQAYITPGEAEQKKLAGIASKLTKFLPPESAYLPILEVLISSTPSKPQLVLVF